MVETRNLDIIVTSAAAERAREFLKRGGVVDDEGNPVCGLRLQIKGSAAYRVRYVFSVDCGAPRQDDKVIESSGFELRVGSDAYAYLSELTETLRIDHVESPEYSGFRVSFPERTITLVVEQRSIPQAGGIRLRRSFAAALIIILLVVGVTGGWIGASMSMPPRTTVNGTTVSIDVVPDFGGSTYDALIIVSNVTGAAPNATSGQRLDNTVNVPLGVPVHFVISSLDSAVNAYFSGRASVPFIVYNDTNVGVVAVSYQQGQDISPIAVGHSFTIGALGISVPIPPLSIVEFNYTFTQIGKFYYYCTIQCGLGMGLQGYMKGVIDVRQTSQNNLPLLTTSWHSRQPSPTSAATSTTAPHHAVPGMDVLGYMMGTLIVQ